MLRWVSLYLLSFLMLASGVHAAELREENNQLVLTATQAAIWSPTPDSTWVVVPEATLTVPDTAALQRLGIQQAQPLEVRGGRGVKLTARRAPQVAWENQTIKPLLNLQDRWIGTRRSWQPADRLAVSDAAGQRFQVLPLDQGVAADGLRGRSDMQTAGRGLIWPVVNTATEVAEATKATSPTTPAPQPAAQLADADVYKPGTVVSVTIPVQEAPSAKDTATIERQRQFAAALGMLKEGLDQTRNATAGIPNTAPPKKREQEEPRRAISLDSMLLMPLSRLHPDIDEETRFHTALQKVQGILLETQPETAAYLKAKKDLARLYIAYKRPLDAIGVLKTLTPDGSPPADDAARMLLAAAYLLDEQTTAAQRIMPTDTSLPAHLALWQGVAAIQQGDFATGYNQLSDNMDITVLYPQYVQLRVRLFEAEALLQLEKYALLAERLTALKELNGDRLPFKGQFILARAQLEQGRVVEGRRILSRLAAQAPEPIAVEAKFLFLQDLLRTAELGVPQYLRLMEQLRFEWRGDSLEGRMLLALGDAYRDEKAYRKALNRYKTFAVVFPEAEENEQVLSVMRETFLDIFEPENRVKLDRLAILGAYYDFRELTPADIRGDRVIEDMANILENLTLFERAARLMERQLTYRVDDTAEKTRLGIALAGLYRKQNLITQASAALENWVPAQDVPEELARTYAMEKARILRAEGNFTQARNLLAGWLDDRAQHLLAAIAWQQEDYVTVTRILTRIFDTNEHAGFEDPQIKAQFMRLTHALRALNQNRALATLVDKYREDLREFPDLAAQTNIALAQQGIDPLVAVPETNSLQQVAQAFDLLEEFESAYTAEQQRIGDVIYERELFNDKMRYMEFMREQGLL